jgi:transposase InsO family protein
MMWTQPAGRVARHRRAHSDKSIRETSRLPGDGFLPCRAELADLLQRYRRYWRWCHQHAPYRLHWPCPGAVWAIDFAQPPQPRDGLYPYLLAVRDLASGQQLLWLPVHDITAAEVQAALPWLFARLGAPLVLKTDNGSPFAAASTQEFLAQSHVACLFSPAYTPSYNGSIEAGIGSLKTRTERHASAAGHPGYWTCQDVAAAQAEANATARPQGPTGPTPDELWQQRRAISAETRAAFAAAVQRQREQVTRKASSARTL